MVRLSCIFICFFCFGCKAQSNEEKMKETTIQFLNAIRDSDSVKFKHLVNEHFLKTAKSDYMILHDIASLHKYYKSYLMTGSPKISNSIDANILSMRKIVIPFYKGEYDSVNNLTGLTLELYFGPPQMVPLSKISRYEMIVDGRKKGDVFAPKVRMK